MRIFYYVTAVALLTAHLTARAECTYPAALEAPPSGATATEAEMIAGRKALMKYQADVDAYLGCLDTEVKARLAAAGEDAEQIKQIKAIASKKHNAAVDELTARVDLFNFELHAYKVKNKK